MGWLFQTWRYIREDKIEFYQMLMSIAPVARTPMDKKSSKGLQNYVRKLSRSLESALPWKQKKKLASKAKSLNLKDGESAIILGEGETEAMFKDLMFENTKVVKE